MREAMSDIEKLQKELMVHQKWYVAKDAGTLINKSINQILFTYMSLVHVYNEAYETQQSIST